MQNLYSTLIDTFFYKSILEEYSILEGEEVMQLNESFKSSLLKNLAKAIHDIESKHRERDEEEAKHWKELGYKGKPSKSERSFASIFGPLTEYQKWSKNKTGIQGLKWSEITDDDFKMYKTDDKAFIKIMKDVYAKKINADFICCEEDTKNPICFIKGYGKEGSDIKVFFFNTKGWDQGVKEKTAAKYTYQVRALKYNEAAEYINGLDVYVLEITDSMKQEYKDLHMTREKSQEGVINCDEDSLKQLLKQQQSRYQALVKKIKAEKLQSDPNILFDEIKKTNDEVVELFKKVISKPENMDQRFNLDDLMRYVSYAYESFYKAMSYKRTAERSVERARAKGDEHAEEWGKYDMGSSDEQIRDAKEYIEKVRKSIKAIESNLK